MPQKPPLQPPPRLDPDRGVGGPAPEGNPRSIRDRRPRPWVVGLMAALIVALVAVVVVLPKMVGAPGEETILEPPREAEGPVPASPPPSNEQTATNPRVDGLLHTVDEALLEGRSALIARDPDAAAAAFRRASILEPGNATAADGLRRTAILAEVRDLEVAAVSHEQRGEHPAAASAARRALKLDPNSQIARAVANRLNRQAYRDAYHDLVTRGLAALEGGEYQQALDNFSAAAKLSPSAREVTDGLSRAKAGIRQERVSAHLARASNAEAAENWPAAVNEYRFALELEPGLAAARDGLTRSGQRLELAQRMNYHLGNPERLATVEVFEEATDLIAEVRTITPAGPRFSELVQRLDLLVIQWSTPVPVVLESDGLTQVMLFRVGQLGAFDRHTTELRPGTYTVIGRRVGFRDVRLTFKVGPGQPPKPVTIRCTDSI